jgi:hypothetical protein
MADQGKSEHGEAAPGGPAIAFGRHLGRWGRARITALVALRPWEAGGDAIVLPIGADSAEPRGRWLDAFGQTLGKDELVARIVTVFRTEEEVVPRIRVLDVTLPSAPDVPGRRVRVLATRVDTEAGEAAEIEDAMRQAVLRAQDLGVRTLVVPVFAERDDGRARQVIQAMLTIESLPPPVELETVVLAAGSIHSFAEVGGPPVRAQAFANDASTGTDLLDASIEAGALAEMLMLRELEPPIVLGVLGGWGSGKSFALHLIAERMKQIRCLPVDATMAWASHRDSAFAYVGHVYTVRFDAWTYAKADLWASLMQTIFSELERQLTLEQRLAEAISPSDPAGKDENVRAEQRREKVRQGGPLWNVLSELDPAEQKRYLSLLTGPEYAEFERLARDGGAGKLWAEIQRRTEEQRKQLAEQNLQLDRLRLDAQRRRAELERQCDEEAVWMSYGALMRARAGSLFDRLRKVIESKDGDSIAGGPLDRLKAIPHLVLQRPLEFAIVVGVVLAIGGLAFWLVYDDARWRAVVAAVTGVVSLIGVWVHAGKAMFGELMKHYGEFQGFVEKVAAVHTEARSIRRKEVVDQDGTLKELEIEVVRIEASVTAASNELFGGEFASLREFVRARCEGESYDSRLGPLQGVQADLRELSRTLAPQSETDVGPLRDLFPRGPARVALFIDDLDRCPPQRVVEVLEATQLLVKTRLFVIVVALDVRFVSRALESVYGGVLSRHGAPSGLDFIEKIIQIPYRVRAIDPPGFGQYLRGQVAIGDDDDSAVPRVVDPVRDTSKPMVMPAAARGRRDAARRPPTDPDQRLHWQQLPTTVLRFSPGEVALLERCGGELALTPRAGKRLINVYKLLKILWHREPDRRPADQENEQAIVALVALSCAYPTVMREVFTFIDTREFHRPGMLLVEVPTVLAPACACTPYQEQLWARAVAAARRIMPPALKLDELDQRAFGLAQAFSFVGDAGFDPEDAAHAGFFDPDDVKAAASPAPPKGPRRFIEW